MHFSIKQSTIITIIMTLLLAGCASASPAVPTNPVSPANPTSVAPAVSVTSTASVPVTGTTPVGTASSSESNNTQYTLVADKNQASYQVREQLANVSLPSDAIGKTNHVTGSVELHPDGSIDTNSSKFVVDMTTLVSDRSMRDNFLRRNILHTDQYQNAVFVPTQVTGLPAVLPTSGDVSFKITGNLTVMAVTKPVTWDVSGTIQGKQASGKATTSFTFEDFSIPQPRVPLVLSIVDHITLVMDLTLEQTAP